MTELEQRHNMTDRARCAALIIIYLINYLPIRANIIIIINNNTREKMKTDALFGHTFNAIRSKLL